MKTNEQIKREIIEDCNSSMVNVPGLIEKQSKEAKLTNRVELTERDRYYMRNWIGKWCSFVHREMGKRVAGKIIKVEPIAAVRNVPNYRVTIEGRTKKVAHVDCVRDYLRIFDDQEKALSDL